MAREKYPECEKLNRLGDERRHLAQFLEWCEERRTELGVWTSGEYRDSFDPLNKRHEQLIFEYLGIDPKKLERERRAMLGAQRKVNARG